MKEPYQIHHVFPHLGIFLFIVRHMFFICHHIPTFHSLQFSLFFSWRSPPQPLLPNWFGPVGPGLSML